jgi:hypothetical protein
MTILSGSTTRAALVTQMADVICDLSHKRGCGCVALCKLDQLFHAGRDAKTSPDAPGYCLPSDPLF